MDGYSGTPPTPPYTFVPVESSAGSMRPRLAPGGFMATMMNMGGMGGMGVTGDAPQAHVDEHAQGQVDEGKEEDGEEKEMDDEEDEA